MKHRLFLILTLLLLTSTLFVLVSCGTIAETDDDYEIRVMISYPKGAVQAPADYVYVTPGEDVYFPIPLGNGYEYAGNDMGAEYIDGVLILKDVRYPTTVTVEVAQKGLSEFLKTQEGGNVHAATVDGEILFSEPVTLTATPIDGYSFIGWSVDGFLLDQGTLVSKSAEYTQMLSAAEPLYANFKSDNQAVICYHLNGGTANGEEVETYYDSFSLDYYHYPNAIADLGTFEKSGHTLLEYTENRDGIGIVTCTGGTSSQETDGIIELWTQWEKWSPSSFFLFENGYIKKYTGSENVVTIPGTIGGQTVVGIRSGAFNGSPMETLIMHKNIQTIESGAFKNCQNLETFYLHDSIQTISDSIFQNCNAFKNFRYNAATLPSTVSQSWAAYARKFERVVYLAGQEHNSMVVLSGSSSLYATDSPLLEELLADKGYDFDVVNFGIQASCPQLFFMEFIEHFMDEGDVVIQAPEYGSGTLGTTISTTHMQVLQFTYNAFRYVDISKYNGLFKAIQSTNATRAKSKTTTYEAQRSDSVTINIYGDRENEHKTGVASGYTPSKLTVGNRLPSDSLITRFNEMYRKFKSNGVRVYYTFAPMAEGAFQSTDADIKAYEDRVDNKLLSPRISSVKDYIIPQEYMYNSDYHTNVEGMIIRTRQLALDLLAQFEKEEN